MEVMAKMQQGIPGEGGIEEGKQRLQARLARSITDVNPLNIYKKIEYAGDGSRFGLMCMQHAGYRRNMRHISILSWRITLSRDQAEQAL